MDRNNAWGLVMKRLRGDRTQAEIAKKAGVKEGRWSEYERGKHYPRKATKEKIAQGLETSVEEMEELERRIQIGEMQDAPGALDPSIIELNKLGDPMLVSVAEDVSVIMKRLTSVFNKILLILAARSQMPN